MLDRKCIMKILIVEEYELECDCFNIWFNEIKKFCGCWIVMFNFEICGILNKVGVDD